MGCLIQAEQMRPDDFLQRTSATTSKSWPDQNQ